MTVPSTVFANPLFSQHFTVRICWDYTNPTWEWDSLALAVFSDSIVNRASGTEVGRAKSILDYFGEDVNPSNTAFAIRTETSVGGVPQDTTYSHFDIYIYDQDETIHAEDDWLTLHIYKDGMTALPPAEVVDDGFSHEWAHNCYRTWDRVGTSISDFNASSSFSEMCAVFSVFMYGRDHPAETGQYGFSLVSNSENDYHAQYLAAKPVDEGGSFPPNTPCLYWSGNRYDDWALFAAYLNHVYSIGETVAGELMHRWIRTSNPAGTVYRHDFDGLAEALDESALAVYFPQATTPHERVMEAFRSYGIAKFLNWQAPGPGEPEYRYQWLDAGGVQGQQSHHPQEMYGFLQDLDGWWYNNIHTFPLYHACSDSLQEWRGWVRSSEIWPAECAAEANQITWPVPEWARRRLVEVGTYASNYVVFTPVEGQDGTLSLRLHFPSEFGSMKCVYADDAAYHLEDRAANYEDEVRLAADLLTYSLPPGVEIEPGGAQGLDYMEAYLDSIITTWIDPREGGSATLFVPDFGEEVNAVALVLSVVPLEPEPGLPTTRIVPYEYSFSVIPETINFWSGLLFNRETMPAGSTQWILDSLLIESIGRLTIEEGVSVHFCGDAAAIVVDGGDLQIEGTAAAPVRFRSSNLPAYRNKWYQGVFAEGSDSLAIAHLDAQDLITLDVEASACRIDHLALSLADTIANAVELEVDNPPGAVALSDAAIENANIVRLNGNAIVERTAFVQRSDYFPLLSPYPLIEVREGEIAIRTSTVDFLEKGLQVGVLVTDSASVAVNDNTIFTGLNFTSKGSSGVECLGRTSIDLGRITVKDASTCLKLRDMATCAVDSSQFFLKKVGIAAWGGARPLILGIDGDPDYPGRNNITLFPGDRTDCEAEYSFASGTCTEHPERVYTTRILNMAADTLYAQNNQWGTCDQWTGTYPLVDCFCPEQSFKPNILMVKHAPRLSQSVRACIGSPEPGFSINVVTTAGEEGKEGVWPNPFNGQVRFACFEPKFSARMEVFDVSGRRVASLAGLRREDGYTEFIWDGLDGNGKPAGSGVYLYKLEGGSRAFKGKVVYVK